VDRDSPILRFAIIVTPQDRFRFIGFWFNRILVVVWTFRESFIVATFSHIIFLFFKTGETSCMRQVRIAKGGFLIHSNLLRLFTKVVEHPFPSLTVDRNTFAAFAFVCGRQMKCFYMNSGRKVSSH